MHPERVVRYLRRRYRVSESEEELAVAALWELGTLGVESIEVEEGGRALLAYFDRPPPAAATLTSLLVDERWIEEEDWMACYRRQVRPIELGRRFVVDPREPGPAPPLPGRILLRLPARTAFGTGSHASTRLALEWMERIDLAGRTVLDVGCGTGILAFAARHLGATCVTGFDIDSAAALMAGQYARLNDLPATFFAGEMMAVSDATRFDLALVNVLPHRVRAAAGGIVARLRPGAEIVLSGVLAAEAELVLSTWSALGVEAADRRDHEEWASWRMVVTAPGSGAP